MVAQFADLGAATRHDDDVVLTELGDVLATAATTILVMDDEDLHYVECIRR
jgi:hypothetical protein